MIGIWQMAILNLKMVSTVLKELKPGYYYKYFKVCVFSLSKILVNERSRGSQQMKVAVSCPLSVIAVFHRTLALFS